MGGKEITWEAITWIALRLLWASVTFQGLRAREEKKETNQPQFILL